MLLVGLVEFISSALLVLSLVVGNAEIQTLGALGIFFTSIGAIFFHLKFDTVKDAIAAIVTLILSSTLILFNGVLITL